jgi:hypothetical protein
LLALPFIDPAHISSSARFVTQRIQKPSLTDRTIRQHPCSVVTYHNSLREMCFLTIHAHILSLAFKRDVREVFRGYPAFSLTFCIKLWRRLKSLLLSRGIRQWIIRSHLQGKFNLEPELRTEVDAL